MARNAGPSDEEYDSAARLGLLGLTTGEDADADSIMEQLAALGSALSLVDGGFVVRPHQ
jgi:hypothetical protein